MSTNIKQGAHFRGKLLRGGTITGQVMSHDPELALPLKIWYRVVGDRNYHIERFQESEFSEFNVEVV